MHDCMILHFVKLTQVNFKSNFSHNYTNDLPKGWWTELAW